MSKLGCNLPTAIEFAALPPERDRQIGGVASAGACCCCCCCLHSLGGVIGAAIAPRIANRSQVFTIKSNEGTGEDWDVDDWEEGFDVARTAPNRRQGYGIPVSDSPSAASYFWWTTLIFAVIATVLGTISDRSPLVGLWILILLLPLLQLGAVLIGVMILGLSSRPDKFYQLSQLGKIALGVILGAIGGIAIMWGILIIIER